MTTLPNPDREVLSIVGGPGCGDAPGTYDVSMANDKALNLKPVDEPCATRRSALAGDWNR